MEMYENTQISCPKVAQLYGVPHGILGVFNNILYENEFQNPQIFQQTISLFPEQSTLNPKLCIQYRLHHKNANFCRMVSLRSNHALREHFYIEGAFIETKEKYFPSRR
jgi:hypothetical protein